VSEKITTAKKLFGFGESSPSEKRPAQLREVPPSPSQLPQSSQLPENSQLPESSQPSQSSQPQESSQLPYLPDGSYGSRQLPHSSQPQDNQQEAVSQPYDSSQLQNTRQLEEPSLNILASLPEQRGHLELPYQILDHLDRHLDPYEQSVYKQLYRLSWGFGKNRCRISNPKLAERTNMSEAMVKKVAVKLVGKGLIEKIGSLQGYGKDQGVEYVINAPSWQVQRSSQLQQHRQPQESRQLQGGSIKERDLKEIDKRDDAVACSDCYGTNWWYPQGTEKGVKRCLHERMKGKGGEQF
jgi:predicted transcriptional regulator